MSNGGFRGEACSRFRHRSCLAPTAPDSRDWKSVPCKPSKPRKVQLQLVPTQTVKCGWRKIDTTKTGPTCHSQPWNLNASSHLQAYACCICLVESLSYLITHLRNFSLSPLILKLLSHPISLRKLKQLEGSAPQTLCTISLLVPPQTCQAPSWLMAAAHFVLSWNNRLLNIFLVSYLFTFFKFLLHFHLFIRSTLTTPLVLGPGSLSCGHPLLPLFCSIFYFSITPIIIYSYMYVLILFIVYFFLPTRLKLCKAVIFVYFI